MKQKNLLQIKNRLKPLLNNKDIIDIILFGSFVKGKENPNDIDIAIITTEKNITEIDGFHTSIINPEEFFINPPTLATTLLKEGFSIKNNKPFSQVLRFENKTMFSYSLTKLKDSEKVRAVQTLRGKNKERGFVEEYKGSWLSNNLFTIPIESEHLFEKLFEKNKIPYKKWSILIH